MLWSWVQPPLGSKNSRARKWSARTGPVENQVGKQECKAYVRIGADKIGYESERIQNKSGHQIWGNCWKLSRVSGKIVKKESREKIFPFCPNPWEDQPSRPRSRLPARPKGRIFSGNCAVGGSIPGKRQKSATPGTRTRDRARRGRKFYPLGQKIAVLKMANKTLRARRKTGPERPRRGRDHEAKIRGRSEARGPFDTWWITK